MMIVADAPARQYLHAANGTVNPTPPDAASYSVMVSSWKAYSCSSAVCSVSPWLMQKIMMASRRFLQYSSLQPPAYSRRFVSRSDSFIAKASCNSLLREGLRWPTKI